ncbi:PREDICTED: uncharacterized protein LOC108779027, partial [Cyphomyrmex costatus]|uniref:uncharacterized protein LOC108779027 n=1 Tax=Cyphomyrmex costatus TaxID=456900 RepID=UPI0008524103
MTRRDQEDIMIRKQEENQMEETSAENNIQVIKKVKEIKKDEEIDKNIATFLGEKDLNENLNLQTLINIGLTDERVRFLKTVNLNKNYIDNLQDLWQAKIKVNKSNDSIINNSTSDSLSSSGHAQLSSNSIYLKRVLSKPLIQALREIIAKKPVDPIEYLGHWLLNYKICEERAIQQKERQLEISINEEKLKLKQFKDKDAVFMERKDEEEHNEDWNYFDYD